MIENHRWFGTEQKPGPVANHTAARERKPIDHEHLKALRPANRRRLQ